MEEGERRAEGSASESQHHLAYWVRGEIASGPHGDGKSSGITA